VLEYLEKGELKWRDDNNRPILKVDQIRPIMRDVVLGLEYLHFQGIIHRDIKPGNLLMSNTGTVKISDFGVSHLAKMDEAGQPLPENDLDLAKTAGSPAFFAPELCQVDSDKPRPAITKAIDVWALGITFFCLLFGREPFPEVHGEMELYKKICNVPIEVPEDCAINLDNDTTDLLQKLLTKDPKDRIKLPLVRRHPFITKGLPDPKKWISETNLAQTSLPLEVSPAEVESAVTLFRNIVRRTLAQVKMTAKRSMSYLRPRHTPGRIISGIHVSGAISPITLPNSPSGNLLSAGVKESSGSSKSDITANRPTVQQHAYFDGKGIDTFIPPTPPHSSKVGHVVPNWNGHVNGHSTKPPPPLTPPPVLPKTEHHLNDDYSNLYYSDSECGSDGEDDSDDGDRLEMKFGSRKI
jgi:serine/threonine protein kinase